jgi:hypothetical protein
MLLGPPLEKDPDADRGIELDISVYRGAAVVSGEPVWVVPSGLTLINSSYDADNSVAMATVAGGQEGCRYLVTCHVDFVSGPSEDFTVELHCRTGSGDPRLRR